MNQEQFTAAIAGTVEQRDAQSRQVSNGFAMTGNRRFMEPDTAAVRLSVTVEAVAIDVASAASAMVAFLNTGTFA